MSVIAKGKTPIRPPMRPPTGRLASLKNPRPKDPEPIKSALRQATSTSGPPKCTNVACPQSDVTSEDGHLVCQSCGTVVRDDHITSEVTFGETANGASVLQGSHVGADQAFTHLSAPGGSKITGGLDTRKIAENSARAFLDGLCESMKLSRMYLDHAMQFFKLCLTNNLIQGRDARHVYCVCLYIACRRSKESSVMLIDFVSVLKIDVFSLGRTYSKIVQALMLQRAGTIDAINPENLIYRFAQKLEFGRDMYRVAKDACQVLGRMDRDWMTVGRRPAGVCGAAIILAARMNNYCRTTREVAYTVKVADVTILQRLSEFKKTRAGQMTVAEFRNHSDNIADAHDPPAYSRQFEVKKKRKRKRRENGTAEDEQSDSDAEVNEEFDDAEASDHAAQSREIPIDPALLPAGEQGKNPTTPQDANQQISEIVEEELLANPPLDESDVVPKRPTIPKTRGKAKAKPPPDPHTPALTVGTKRKRGRPAKDGATAATTASPSPAKRSARAALQLPIAEETLSAILEEATVEGESSSAQTRADDQASVPPPPRRVVSDSPIIDEDEFADDPDVYNCLRTAEETAVKERIWLEENGQYLRAQEAKRIRAELEEANGTARIILRRKRRRGRMGDASQYHTVNEDGTTSGPATPAEAVQMMLKTRAFSRKINYDAVEKLYGGKGKEKEGEDGGDAPVDANMPADDNVSVDANVPVHSGEAADANMANVVEKDKGPSQEDASPPAEELAQTFVVGGPSELEALVEDFGDEDEEEEEEEDPDPDEEGDYDEMDYVG